MTTSPSCSTSEAGRGRTWQPARRLAAVRCRLGRAACSRSSSLPMPWGEYGSRRAPVRVRSKAPDRHGASDQGRNDENRALTGPGRQCLDDPVVRQRTPRFLRWTATPPPRPHFARKEAVPSNSPLPAGPSAGGPAASWLEDGQGGVEVTQHRRVAAGPITPRATVADKPSRAWGSSRPLTEISSG